MKKRTKYRIFYSALSILLALFSLYLVIDYLYIHISPTDENIWSYDRQLHRVTIHSIVPGGASDRAGLKPGDVILAIDGKEIRSIRDATEALQRHKPGDVAIYRIQRDGQILEVPVHLEPYKNYPFLLRTFIGLLFLIVGWTVVVKKPLMRTPRLFYYFSLTFFLVLAFSMDVPGSPTMIVSRILRIIGLLLWAPAILHFFLNFPVRASILNKHPRFIWLIYIPSFLVVGYVFFIGKNMDILISGMLTLYIALSFFLLVTNRRKIANPHERKSLTIITWGMAFGLVPLGITALFTQWMLDTFGATVLYVVFGLMALVPIAFGYSIMRYGLMDVEIIVRKSLIYSLVTGFLVILYFAIVVWLGGWLARSVGLTGQWPNFLFLAAVALAIQPVRRQIQKIVDRHFYRERYSYQKTLLSLSQELPGLTQMKDILKRVADTLVNAMHVESVFVHLYDQKSNSYPLRYSEGRVSAPSLTWKEQRDGLIELLSREKQALLFYRIEEDERYNNLPIEDKIKLEKNQIVLSVPLLYQNRLIGLINLGPKKSGQVYSQDDLDLLQTVAGNAAIALINAHLHQEDLLKQRLENEILMARHIQQSLLPKSDPVLPGFEIVGYSQPATLVGGDYFDYIPVSPNRLFVLVGDVAGKGMPAALYMSKVQGMVHVAAGIYNRPKKLLVDINRHIYERLDRRYFITMLAALLDGRQRKMIISRAGHMPVLIQRDGKIEQVLSRGIGLGLEKGEIFERELEETEFKLRPGDLCLFYSDGLVETQNAHGEFYGEERLIQFLENRNSEPAASLKEALLQDLKAFQQGQKQQDDITFVIIRAV